MEFDKFKFLRSVGGVVDAEQEELVRFYEKYPEICKEIVEQNNQTKSEDVKGELKRKRREVTELKEKVKETTGFLEEVKAKLKVVEENNQKKYSKYGSLKEKEELIQVKHSLAKKFEDNVLAYIEDKIPQETPKTQGNAVSVGELKTDLTETELNIEEMEETKIIQEIRDVGNKLDVFLAERQQTVIKGYLNSECVFKEYISLKTKNEEEIEKLCFVNKDQVKNAIESHERAFYSDYLSKMKEEKEEEANLKHLERFEKQDFKYEIDKLNEVKEVESRIHALKKERTNLRKFIKKALLPLKSELEGSSECFELFLEKELEFLQVENHK